MDYNKRVQKGGGYVTYCHLCRAPISDNGIFTLKNLKKYNKYFNIGVDEINSADNFIEWLDYQKNIPEKIKKEMLNNITYLKNKKYKWMNDLLLLHWSGMILKIKSYDSWEHEFIDKFDVNHLNFGNNFIVHKDCYEITKHKYGDYNSLYIEEYDVINYGFIKKYNAQEYQWLEYFNDDIDYILESPLKNSKNKKRILNINHKVKKKIIPKFIDFLSAYKKNNKIPGKGYKWMIKIISYSRTENIRNYMVHFEKVINNSQHNKNKSISTKILSKSSTKFKVGTKKIDRPSPSESATKFKVGTKKKGNDGNKWVIVENKNGVRRWNKYQ